MNITGDDAFWTSISEHLRTTNSSGGAPWPVQLQVAALLGGVEIEASVTQFDATKPSMWSVYVVAKDARLIEVVVQFDAERFDGEAETIEQRDDYAQETTPPNIRLARVRSLSGATAINFGELSDQLDNFGRVRRNDYRVSSFAVDFIKGPSLAIDFPEQPRSSGAYADQQRIDKFIAAVRKHTRL